jgi:hypothetical protein
MTTRDAENTSGGDNPGLQKDPQDWASGDDPMTPAQASYLETLARQAGEEVPDGLSKAAASEKIDELRGEIGFDNDAGDGSDPSNTPVSPNANR